jgi:tRNA threonylcarbamoyladenosine biosynthesis protein TsaB
MGEVYAACFERTGGELRALTQETVVVPDAFELPAGSDDWHGVGTGFAALDGVLQSRLAGRFAHIDASALPHAADVARLGAAAFARGEFVPPERLEPAYLRNAVALTLVQQAALRAST